MTSFTTSLYDVMSASETCSYDMMSSFDMKPRITASIDDVITSSARCGDEMMSFEMTPCFKHIWRHRYSI